MSCHGSQNIRSALLGRQTSSASFRNLLSAAPRVGGRQVRCFSSRKATNAHVRKDVEVQRQEDKLAFRTSEEGSEEHLEQRHCSQLQASTNNEEQSTSTRWSLASLANSEGDTKLLGLTSLIGTAAVAGGGFLGTGFDTAGPLSVASALAVLAAIVTVHECGHFVAARAQNIHVTQFSIGFGPSLFSYKGPKVEYSLRAIPLGGFVGFPDDDPKSEFKPDDPDLLRNRSIPGRLTVMSAGIIANCIFALSVLFVQASTVGMGETSVLPGVKVPKVVPGSVAELAGMRKGDVVVAVGDRPISNSRENVNRLVQYIKDRPEKRLVFKVARKDGVVDIPVVTELDADGDGKIGAQLATYAKLSRRAANGPLDAAGKAGREFVRMVQLVGQGLLSVVTNFKQTKDAVSGPLAIVAAGADVARSDAASLLQFAAIVNVNLAIVNALPLPALDGGYILLICIEAIRGKKLDKVVEQTFMASGFLLLTGLGMFLVVRDVFNLGSGLL